MAKEMKTYIKEFLKHVETLEGETDEDGCGIQREYRHIYELQIKNRRENIFTSEAGKENFSKNRYKDIMPYDDHRVILKTVDDVEGSDYINASLIQGVKGSGGYIASQGPLASTVDDFWRMIWEKEVEIVFMACRIVELGKIKCKQYWNDEGESDVFGDIDVFTESEENISSDFIKRVFKVTRGETKRTVIHYHYSGWPDHGIPSDPAHIRDLIAIMRQARRKVEIPIVVHCSAGCGRTGAIIAIDYVWTLLEEGKLDEKFSLYKLICEFREQRMSIVQTPGQYALVYQVLKSLCEDWLAKMASHTYVNVEVEDSYVNVGSDNADDEEPHIYEDSQSLKDNPKLKASPSKSPSLPGVEEASSSYANVELHNGQPRIQQQHSTNNSSSSSSSLPGNENNVLHKTVIQIGSPSKKSATAPSPPSPSTSSTTTAAASAKSGKKEVVNLIRSDTSFPRAAVTKSQPLPDTTPLSLSVSGQVSTTTTTTTGVANRKSASLVDPSGSRLVQVPDSPPGFNQRLPRVRAPVPMPPHWNKS